MSHCVYLGFGSNLNNPLNQIITAISELNDSEKIVVNAVSNIYKSKPLDVNTLEVNTENIEDKQDDYINAVVNIETQLTPIELLDILQALELKHNRIKEYRWGPRSLDVDILLYDDDVIDTERLTIPHVGLISRNFVLYPLNDINPLLIIPKHGALKNLLAKVNEENLMSLGKYLEMKDLER